MTKFEQFLIDKGWKRFKRLTSKPLIEGKFQKEYSDESNLSTYSPTEYFFEHENYPKIEFCWGLREVNKPPVMFLSPIIFWAKNIEDWESKTQQDVWFYVLENVPFDELYEAYLTGGKIELI